MEAYQVIIQGCGSVGKSAIAIQFVNGVFVSKYDPTIEDSYRKPYQYQSEYFLLEIIDTAGTEQFSSMRDLYMKNGNGFLLVCSLTSASSLNELGQIQKEIQQVKNSQSVPMVLCANKNDLSDTEKELTEQDVQKLAKQWKIPYLLTSAKTNTNIEEAFTQLSGMMLQEKKSETKGKPSKSKNSKCTIL